ncbi:hypothetical protein [Thorsellia kenyensis]|uniref:Uncharacterized protein n=1 Tax=Thorsellia kenyensis TaxID=1549888 RepID=A0ABV6C9F2_9GAMM
MIIKKNLGGLHFYVNNDDANSLLFLLDKLFNENERIFCVLESGNDKSYSTLEIGLSDDDYDYIEIERSLISLYLSYDSIALAINKLKRFLSDGFFITPEWCECENNKKMISIYFMNK